ncbi:MAG: hypothetical protein IKX47_03985 [Oscillospiraceae bacterium]|nr:hypothetical protein [Oscillospiraceae bacterium]
MSFTFIPACGEDQLDLFASPGRLSATLAYNLDRPFPAPRSTLRGGCMILGGRIRSARAAETANECRRRGIGTVVCGFSPCPGLELLRFCEVLRRRGIRCVITERLWQEGCGAAVLLSTAISGGTLRRRMEEAVSRCGEVYLDLERTRRIFPMPCPDGEGRPIGPEELEQLSREAETCFFSQDLQCKVCVIRRDADVRFVLYDDPDTLRCKTELAMELGIRWGFLLLTGEWSSEDLKLLRQVDKNPAIRR